MLRDFCVVPVAVNPFWGYDQETVEFALVIEHRHVVDQHKALACAHVGKERCHPVLPEALKVSLLVYKGLVFKGIG